MSTTLLPFPESSFVSPAEELRSFEILWSEKGQTVKNLSESFDKWNSLLPSETLKQVEGFVPSAIDSDIDKYLAKQSGFSVSFKGCATYPVKMEDVKYPPRLFYYKGDVDLLTTPCISIVGARECTPEGALRAAKLAKGLVERGYTIVSGLAKGIDTAAMKAAIESSGNVIGVIGTPIDSYYPPENKELQDLVAKKHLLISHIPLYRYHLQESFLQKRNHFVERNAIMSAISEATVIVEASDTSGTLTQARAAIQQGRKLFILNSCFENPSITYPKRFESQGAIRVRDFDDIFRNLDNG